MASNQNIKEKLELLSHKKDNVEQDYNDDKDVAESYSEISLDALRIGNSYVQVKTLDGFKNYSSIDIRPETLCIKNDEPKSGCHSASSQKVMDSLQSEGMVINDGNLVLFVAEDLENKIKLSSPVTKKWDTASFSESQNFNCSIYKPQCTLHCSAVDLNILNELENEARKVATSVDSITENLAAILHSASALTVGCLETYRDAVCKTCDAVDYNIKSMYQLMAKCEELSKCMDIMYKISEKIKDIKKILEIFENSMS